MSCGGFRLILLLVVIQLSTASDHCHGGDLEDEVQHLRAMLEGNRIRTRMALDCIFEKMNETCPRPVTTKKPITTTTTTINSTITTTTTTSTTTTTTPTTTTTTYNNGECESFNVLNLQG